MTTLAFLGTSKWPRWAYGLQAQAWPQSRMKSSSFGHVLTHAFLFFLLRMCFKKHFSYPMISLSVTKSKVDSGWEGLLAFSSYIIFYIYDERMLVRSNC